jgi:hypothetical protein
VIKFGPLNKLFVALPGNTRQYIRQMMKVLINYIIVFYSISFVYVNCFRHVSQWCVNIFYFTLSLCVYEYHNVIWYLNFLLKGVKYSGDRRMLLAELLPLIIWIICHIRCLHTVHCFQTLEYSQNWYQWFKAQIFMSSYICQHNRLCGLVVRVPGYRSRGPGFDSRFSEK